MTRDYLSSLPCTMLRLLGDTILLVVRTNNLACRSLGRKKKEKDRPAQNTERKTYTIAKDEHTCGVPYQPESVSSE